MLYNKLGRSPKLPHRSNSVYSDPNLPYLEADGVNDCGLNNLLPGEHSPRHGNWLLGITVCYVLSALGGGGGGGGGGHSSLHNNIFTYINRSTNFAMVFKCEINMLYGSSMHNRVKRALNGVCVCA